MCFWNPCPLQTAVLSQELAARPRVYLTPTEQVYETEQTQNNTLHFPTVPASGNLQLQTFQPGYYINITCLIVPKGHFLHKFV